MNIDQLNTQAESAATLLKSMANENRLMILCQLRDGEKSVGTMADLIGLRQSALSQHLARLRNEGLVRTRRDAQTIYYSLASKEVEALIGCLYSLYCEK